MNETPRPAETPCDEPRRPAPGPTEPSAEPEAVTAPFGGRADWAAVGLLVGLVVLFFWRVLLLGEVLLPLDLLGGVQPWYSESTALQHGPYRNLLLGDADTQQYPEAVAAQRGWAHGLPLWEPGVLTGMPAAASGGAYTNPILVVLSRFLAADRALSLATVIHLLVGALGCFLLLRELRCGRLGALLGSVVFAFNTYLVGWLSNPTLVGTWVWLPLLFFGFEAALERRDARWALLGGVAFALQILSGFLLCPLYGGITLALYAVALAVWRGTSARAWRPAFAPLAWAGVIWATGAALAAPFLLLAAELFGRIRPLENVFANSFMPLLQMARLVVPRLWGSPLGTGDYTGWFNYVETTLYLGIPPLVFVVCAMAARRGGRAVILIGIGLLTWLAVFHVPLATQLVGWAFPLFVKTSPGRVFYVTAFAWAVAAGLGADWLERTRPARLLRRLAAGSAAAALLLLAGAAFVTLNGRPGLLVRAQVPAALLVPTTAAGRSVLLAVLWLLVTAALLWLWTSPRRRWVGPALLVVTVADLFVLGIGFNPSFPRALLFPETPSLVALRQLAAKETQPFRVLGVPGSLVLPGEMPEIWGLPTPGGYSSWVLNRYAIFSRLVPLRTGWESQVYFDDCCHRLVDALNVKYVLAAVGRTPSGTGRIALDQLLGLGHATTASVFEGGLGAITWKVDGRERPVIFAAGPTTAEFRIQVPPGGRFKTAIGVSPDAWTVSDGVSFLVSAGLGDASQAKPEFAAFLDPRSKPEDRRPLPVDVDLSRYSGSTVTLILATGPGPAGDTNSDWAGWIEPVVESAEEPGLELVFDGPNAIYRNRRALPRAWLVRSAIQVPPGDLEVVRRCLASSTFEPESEAVIEGQLPGRLGAAHPQDRVHFTSYAAERVELEVATTEPGLLVMSDMVYPGWHVLVDGAEQVILPTNMIMRGVYIGAGEHRVVFEYRPAGLRRGIAIALATVVAMVAALAVSTTRRRRARGSTAHG